MNEQQQTELLRLKAYYPFRIVWGAISPQGEWVCGASPTKREANKLAREGWKVYILQK